MRLPRFPDAAPTPVPAPAPDDVFPGIFKGSAAGDFGGLPPTPGEVTGRVPELAIRLSAIAHLIDGTLGDRSLGDDFAEAAYDCLKDTSTKLHALADELAAEAGDQ